MLIRLGVRGGGGTEGEDERDLGALGVWGSALGSG